MSLSATRQRNAVSDGVALGLLMCDQGALPYDKVRIDLSFTGAWRGWEYKARFPQVTTDLSKGLDGIWAMTRVDERKRSFNLYWQNDGGEWVIYPRGVWSEGQVDAEQAADSIDGDIPADGWRKLAAAFLERFLPIA
ncbi:hypothetical protein [Aeromicrobium ginsengisoli]|uniref:Uncharacterized protein n=1 Tax=Aeromicrobium ginsengisoli TaxID=363867 RepID=A0A5M4FIX4_9ACTN|nr:hypothetical protein [Aeromicrobium ginsengisoli]KAA1399908.1 hypothetical protein ESP70_003900 [Aeromicrobium ginsengisoli]